MYGPGDSAVVDPRETSFESHQRILKAKMAPTSPPEISDDLLALLNGTIKRMRFRDTAHGSESVVC
jgi:hypothetical protein